MRGCWAEKKHTRIISHKIAQDCDLSAVGTGSGAINNKKFIVQVARASGHECLPF